MIHTIEDPHDSRITPFIAVREKDLVGRQGLCIAEGEVVLRLLVSRPDHRILSLLLSRASAARLESLLAGLDPAIPLYVADQPVMDAIVGFHIHRGILALVEPRAAPAADTLLSRLPARAVVAGLVGLTNHDNVGGIFRNAAAFGIDAVLLDGGCCDPLYRKAIRVSVGASLIVPYARLSSGADMAQRLVDHGFDVVCLSPSGTIPLHRLERRARVGALFGAEGPGLPDDLLARLRGVAIPMAPGFDSLNVATASGIVLHHLVYQHPVMEEDFDL